MRLSGSAAEAVCLGYACGCWWWCWCGDVGGESVLVFRGLAEGDVKDEWGFEDDLYIQVELES